MMRVALYARFSSEHQRESSITDQFRNCETRAAREGWQIVERFQDKAISGSMDETGRPGYAAMLQAARAKQFDILLIDDLSRLSRDSRESEQTRRRLIHWGLRLVSASDGIDTSLRGNELMFGFKGLMSQHFVSDLKDKISRGMTGKALGGFHLGGRTYGYRLVPVEDETRKDAYGRPERVATKLAIDEAQAEWVRWIFEHYADGWSPHRIVTELNRQQVPAPGAHYKRKRYLGTTPMWSAPSLQGSATLGTGLLNNPLYTGRILWNRKRREKDPDTGIRSHIARDPSEWIQTDAPHLRIIDPDLWERATARRAAISRGLYDLRLTHSRARTCGRNPKYLFSGLLVCGLCGQKFVVCSHHDYCCSTWRTRGETACANMLKVPRKLVEQALIAAIQKDLFTPDGMEVFKQEFTRLLASQRRTRRPDVAKATARLQDIERELAGIITAIKAGVFSGTTKMELDRLEAEQAALMATVKGKNKMYEKVIEYLPNMESRFKKLIDDLVTVAQPEVDQARNILRELLGGKIRLHPTSEGRDRFLNAELTGDYHGLLRLACGQKLLVDPLRRYRSPNHLIATGTVTKSTESI